TADRERALEREDIQFLSWDHPLVSGAIDIVLGSEKGNCSFARQTDGSAVVGLALEVIYVLECVAPPQLHVDRFLPPTPVGVLVDHRGAETEIDLKSLKRADGSRLLRQPEIRDELLPRLIDRTLEIARGRVPGIVATARMEMTDQLDKEIA